jgi:hypothetical protein
LAFYQLLPATAQTGKDGFVPLCSMGACGDAIMNAKQTAFE